MYLKKNILRLLISMFWLILYGLTSCENSQEREHLNDNTIRIRQGWKYLYQFKATKDVSELLIAKDLFVEHLKIDPNNYSALWGLGIVKTEESQQELKETKKVELCLIDAIQYMNTAMKTDFIPKDEKKQLKLDLSNAYIGLGVFYQQQGEDALSKQALGEASNMLDKMLELGKKDSNVYQMLSFVAFYQGEYEQAMLYCKKAETLGVSFPSEYKTDLNKALNQ